MSDDPILEGILSSQSPLDESLHSFLVRTLLAHDPNVKPVGVISESGCWIREPFIHEGYEHLFSQHPDHLLLEMIDISKRINGKGNLLFDNPANYASSIEETFFSGQRLRKNYHTNHPIKYCLSCIEEGIQEVGYGYFRHFWSYSNICLIHEKSLCQLPELSFSKTISAVKSLLGGKGHKDAIVLNHSENDYLQRRSSGTKQKWNSTGKYFFPIKFSVDCLMPKFARSVYHNHSDFRNENLKSLAKRVSSDYVKRYDREREYDYKINFSSIYLICASLEPQYLDAFYANHIALVRLELGPRKQGRLREIFAKNKDSDCAVCRSRDCPLKGQTELRLVDAKSIDSKYLYENSYMLSRIAMRGRPVAWVGDSPWAPIDVHPVLEKGVELERIDVMLGYD